MKFISLLLSLLTVTTILIGINLFKSFHINKEKNNCVVVSKHTGKKFADGQNILCPWSY